MSGTILTIVILFLRLGEVGAWFRVACTDPLVQERVDPIRSPGKWPTNHVHTVHGASNFNASSTYESLRKSNCTSCEVSQDLSNYWFPRLYFQDPQTKLFEPVPNGGLLVYYQNRGNKDVSTGGPGLKAFPPGFKMVSGNPAARSHKLPIGQGSQEELRERALEWSCLRYPGDSGYNDNGTGFPTTDCEAGFNARIHMPACWDGVNADSEDHISHTAYLSGLDNGDCPSTHPVGLMKLFFEVTWNVHEFASRWAPGKGKWPFVYSTGDATGYSWHGDFQNGWDTVALQNAIDHCNNPGDATGSGNTAACPFLNVTTAAIANQCKINSSISENVEGKLMNLPGCNPIQAGPKDATMYLDSNCPFQVANTTQTPSTNTTSPTSNVFTGHKQCRLKSSKLKRR